MASAPILITGAGGFVCSEIAAALARSGADVIAVDKAFDPETRTRLAGVRLVEGDLCAGMPESVGAVSSIIHGAAITSSPECLGISRAEHIRCNTDMLTATLDFARGAGASRFLFLSSMGVFAPDDIPSDGQFTEATRPTADCAYCAAKQAGEVLAAAAAEPNFTTLSLRLGNIFGPHETVRETRQTPCLVWRMMEEAQADGLISLHTPEAQREWSWLPDLAMGISALIKDLPRFEPHVLHAGTPPVISDLDLARLVAARIPGTTIRLASRPYAQIRPPMASGFKSVLSDVVWTGMRDALDHMMTVRALT